MNDLSQARGELNRLPGLFRSHELRGYFADPQRFYHEPAGHHEDGSELFAVFYWQESQPAPRPAAVEFPEKSKKKGLSHGA